MPLTTNIAESSNIRQQKNSSSNIFLHSLTVALNLTIQGRINYHISRKKVVVQNYPIKETGATHLLKPYELLVEKTYN